ncbi:hypothetical protein JTB14_027431 [Gonioctena quinquepunctata]|nr:hypothetical protein JTB14_027431 [Gonioctena quinquepunctata]
MKTANQLMKTLKQLIYSIDLFTEIGEKLASVIERKDNKKVFPKMRLSKSFFLEHVTEQEVEICIRTLKNQKAPGPDGIKSEHLLHRCISLKPSPLGRFEVRREFPAGAFSKPIRSKRTLEHHITDCIYMTSEEGEYYHKAGAVDGQACGAYIFSEPDQLIEIHLNYLNVPCEKGGLISVVDGWELNGEFFPSPHDHPRPLRQRFQEFCGEKTIKQIFASSQNVALIQYRMPARGASFSFNVRFVKNPTPCNVLSQTDGIYTLRNYGKRMNCSLSTIFPAVVKVAALDVGATPVTAEASNWKPALSTSAKNGDSMITYS